MLIENGKRRSVGIGIRNLSKSFGLVNVLDSISLDIPAGNFVALLGPSGCGKTTLLRTIAGLENPSRGAIHIGDRRVVDTDAGVLVPPQERRLGMVFQHYALWPHMTVWQNICYPLRKQGVPKSEWEPRIKAVADAVGLPTILERRPSQLSGGQQQRVALARALVARPNVLLLDEPLSNLDANLRDQLRRELRQLHDRHAQTSILVTHDQEEAAMLADIIAVIDRGTVVQVGHPNEILENPANRFVAGFVGYDNFISALVEEADDADLLVRLPSGDALRVANPGSLHRKGAPVVVASRSTRVTVAPTSDPRPEAYTEVIGRVKGIQSLGRWRELTIDCRGTPIIARDLASNVQGSWLDLDVHVRIPRASPVLADPARN